MLASSRLTRKNQTTIPANIRKMLRLNPGDAVTYDLKEGDVVIKKASPLDVAFTKALESTLSEWASEEDEEAYRDL
jgi:antitoxin PrlF